MLEEPLYRYFFNVETFHRFAFFQCNQPSNRIHFHGVRRARIEVLKMEYRITKSIRQRRRRILTISICVILAVPCAPLFSAESNLPPSFELKAENGQIAFYFSHETGEFAVIKKETGRVWRSNPAGEASGGGLFFIWC